MPEPSIRQLTGVFEVLAEVDGIGGQPGDRLVVRTAPRNDRPFVLVRPLPVELVHFAFDEERVRFEFTKPDMVRGVGLRLLREQMGGAIRRQHLTLV